MSYLFNIFISYIHTRIILTNVTKQRAPKLIYIIYIYVIYTYMMQYIIQYVISINNAIRMFYICMYTIHISLRALYFASLVNLSNLV